MSNFTVSIPDDLLTEAKVVAARSGVSLNAIIRNLLEGVVQNTSVSMSGNFEILMKYSLGQVSAKRAGILLHLEDESLLVDMTKKAGLPIPTIALREAESMRKRFGKMLDQCA